MKNTNLNKNKLVIVYYKIINILKNKSALGKIYLACFPPYIGLLSSSSDRSATGTVLPLRPDLLLPLTLRGRTA